MVRAHLCAASILATLLAATLVAAQPAADPRLDQARAALRRDDYARAYELLSQLWATDKSGQVAGLLGQAERELGRCADALRHFEVALAEPPETRPTDALDLLRSWMTDCQTKVGKITLQGVTSGADVVVDGAVVGQTPLTQPILLDPGEHVVEIRRSGQVTGRAAVTAIAGQSDMVRIDEATTAEPEPTAPLVQPQPHPSAPYQPSQPPPLARRPAMWPVYVGGGAFVVGLASAIGFRAAAESKLDEANDHQASCRQTSGVAGCSELREAADAHDRRRLWSDIGGVVALASAVGTATYLILAPSLSGGTAVSAGVSYNGGGGTAFIQGRF